MKNIETIPDSELISRYVHGRDQRAFQVLVERYGPMVLRVATRIVGRGQADDVFQAVFLTFAVKAEIIRKRKVIAPWLHRVAFRAAIDLKRREQRWKRNVSAASERAAADDQPSNALVDVCQVLDEELDRLPEHYRRPIILCDLQGTSLKDAATQLKVAVGTISSRLSRGRQQLKRRLVKRGVQLGAGGLLAAVHSAAEAATTVAPEFVSETVNASFAYTAGVKSADSFLSPVVTDITRRVLLIMLLEKLRVGALIATVGITVSAAGVSQVGAKTIFYDDFADDLINNRFVLSSDGVVNRPINGSVTETALGLRIQADPNGIVTIPLSDTEMSARTTFRTSSGSAGLQVSGYLIAYDGENSTASLWREGPTMVDEITVPFNSLSQDVTMQLDVFGKSVQGWVWPASLQMPALPTFTHSDPDYSRPSSNIELSAWDFEGNGADTVFRWILVSDASIVPEPTTTTPLGLSTLLILWRRLS